MSRKLQKSSRNISAKLIHNKRLKGVQAEIKVPITLQATTLMF